MRHARSPRWSCSYEDALGRTVCETRPGFRGALLVTSNEYNAANQLIATRAYALNENSTPTPLTYTYFCYNSLGQRCLTDSDMNLNSQIDWNDTDRIVSNDTRYVSLNGDWWRESSTWQTRQNGSSAAINPWRFSAEYAEEDTATVYYNYRHSLQREGRWLSRDLIGEKDGGNEYAYNKNSLGGYDRLGLSCCGGNLGDFGSLITSHFLGESAGCIPPPGLVPNQSTANEPCSGSVGVSLAAYCVWGGSVSFESGICCQGGSRYRWVTMTTCVGLGVGAKLPTPDIPSVSKSGKGECPSEGTVYTIGTGFDLPFGTLGARAETFGISPVDGGYCSRKGCDVKDVCDFYQPSVGLSLAWRFFDICSTSRIKFERID